jgi:hypothetical protein
VPPTAGLKEVLWGNVTAAAAPAAAAAVAPAPVAEEKRARWPLFLALGVLAVVLVGALIAVLASSGDDGFDDPDDVRSTSHEVGEPSTDNVVEMVWSRRDDVQAYSIDWTEERSTLPDEEGDLSGEATDATSPELDPGEWYFHLRTQSLEGEWTSTVHVGPFEIIEEATETPEPTEEPTEEPTPEPTEEPTEEPTPEPTPEPTEEPTPVPTAAATPPAGTGAATPPAATPDAATPSASP